jgi:hypothetical protein
MGRARGLLAARFAAALLATALLPVSASAYADRAGTDIVMDAPWRTVRDYVPVLFFFPQFEGGRHVERIRIMECVEGRPSGPPVFVDAADGPDSLNGATIIGALGEPRGGLTAGEPVTSFWHYVVRLPHASLRHHGTPDVHELRAEVEWTRPGVLGRGRLRNHRVLRVIVDAERFPKFGPGDRYLDVHAHTIAEQSGSGVFDVNGSHKAFAGPLVMLVECAYALGLVETPPRAGLPDYAGSLVVTDHNVFYSGAPFDAGTAPRAGPTSATDGRAGEGAWYRSRFGALAGEEITLRRGSRQDGSMRPNIGHHLLAYGTRHFEGPWHGGLFLTSRLENPNTLEAVLAGMKAAGDGGFAYAAHPDLESFEWPPEYYAQGVGFAPFDSKAGPQVDAGGTEFQFKGLQVWNSKIDAVAKRGGRLAASRAFDVMNPFPGGPDAQRFVPRAWDAELSRSLDTLYTLIARGLRHSFRESPEERFVRKLYMSAGSDAHGDFNYTDEVTATAVPYSGALNRNAWARVRTLALLHDRPEGARDAASALADGHTVLTDGPIVRFALDADGRHDPDAGAARWHDGESRWENEDGRIGGAGAFDGGGTALVPVPGDRAWVRSLWHRSVTPDAGTPESIYVERITESGRDAFGLAAGVAGVSEASALPIALDRLCALVASLRDPGVDERCITNPVWVAPVGIDVALRPAGAGAAPGALLPPGSLRVTFRFPFSMSASAGTRVFVRPLDASGVSTDPAVELVPDPGWQADDAAAASRFTVVNAVAIPAPEYDWDAASHASLPGIASYVVYLEHPTDLHHNVLNDVGRAFALARSAATRR